MTAPHVAEIPEVAAAGRSRRLPQHAVDGAAIVVLTALALLGFHASFGFQNFSSTTMAPIEPSEAMMSTSHGP